jgi:hypothetical protein
MSYVYYEFIAFTFPLKNIPWTRENRSVQIYACISKYIIALAVAIPI